MIDFPFNRWWIFFLSFLSSDQDGDELLTEDEFSSLPSEGLVNAIEQTVSVSANFERREEFRHLIDKNKDERADRAELLVSIFKKTFLKYIDNLIKSLQAYIDPRNPRHAIQEAQHLIELSDVDHDGRLKLSEILSKTELFLGSKVVDTEGSFHDEFRWRKL